MDDDGTILDAHMHAWDAGRFHLAWSTGIAGFAERGMTAYRAACAGTGIAASIIVEADVASGERGAEAADFVDRHRCGEVVASVPCLDPRDAGFVAAARALAGMPGVRGVRWIARGAAQAAELAASPVVLSGLRALGELGLTFDLNVPPDQLELAAGFAAAVPGTRIVLDHCGNADPAAFGCRQDRAPLHPADAWRRGIERLAALPHVACKLSGIVSSLAPGTWAVGDLAPVAEHCLAEFGPRRLLFGSDWPVCQFGGGLAPWLAAARALTVGLPSDQRQAVFGGNARHWYGLAE